MEFDRLSDLTGHAAAARLARELQVLKFASGLSFARISERTHYAKSSWERWVNGKKLPPRGAVERFAGLTGGEAEPLLHLWDLATRQAAAEAVAEVREPATEPPTAAAVFGATRVLRALAQPVFGLLSGMTGAIGTGVGAGARFVVELHYSQPGTSGWRGSLSLAKVAGDRDEALR